MPKSVSVNNFLGIEKFIRDIRWSSSVIRFRALTKPFERNWSSRKRISITLFFIDADGLTRKWLSTYYLEDAHAEVLIDHSNLVAIGDEGELV